MLIIESSSGAQVIEKAWDAYLLDLGDLQSPDGYRPTEPQNPELLPLLYYLRA